MNGPLDGETRDNLSKSHAASKVLLSRFCLFSHAWLTLATESPFYNQRFAREYSMISLFMPNLFLLQDLTRLETGNETSFNEAFNLHLTIEEASHLYRKEAERRNIRFILDLSKSPTIVVGDAKKIRTVVQNLTANARTFFIIIRLICAYIVKRLNPVKYTTTGSITVSCTTYGEPEGLRSTNQTAVEIRVSDTGRGIPPGKLESIFREFEQVESSEPRSNDETGVGMCLPLFHWKHSVNFNLRIIGLGLAVVARIVEQLGGQLRVDSNVNQGSTFSFLIPLSLSLETGQSSDGNSFSSSSSPGGDLSRRMVSSTPEQDIENLVTALSSSHLSLSPKGSSNIRLEEAMHSRPKMGSRKHSANLVDNLITESSPSSASQRIEWHPKSTTLSLPESTKTNAALPHDDVNSGKLRILIVEVRGSAAASNTIALKDNFFPLGQRYQSNNSRQAAFIEWPYSH